MTADDVRILCTGDLHLGRYPTRVPERYDSPSCSPKAVWRRTVEVALEEDVTAVLVSGDVIDRENRYYEAYGAFENGAARLNDAEISTVVVTGNHDFDTLPQLVSDIDLEYLTLLGEEGTWDRETITQNGSSVVHIDGWSFPREHVHDSPLESYSPDAADAPVLGLLHADFGTAASDYAPVSRAELEATPADAWVLGHIHTPGVRVAADPHVLYPGSPQGLDPGESGTHGPWLLDVDRNGRVDAEQLPQAAVRYDTLAIDVSDAESPTAVPGRIEAALESYVPTIDTSALELLIGRFELTGRTDIHGELVEQRAAMEDQLQFKIGSIQVVVESIAVETEPAVDLETLADGDSPVAYLADLLLHLEQSEQVETDVPDNTYDELIADVTAQLREVHTAGTYAPLQREGRLSRPDQDVAVNRLRQQARRLLYELRAQEAAGQQ